MDFPKSMSGIFMGMIMTLHNFKKCFLVIRKNLAPFNHWSTQTINFFQTLGFTYISQKHHWIEEKPEKQEFFYFSISLKFHAIFLEFFPLFNVKGKRDIFHHYFYLSLLLSSFLQFWCFIVDLLFKI